jgi:hypothetical protein
VISERIVVETIVYEVGDVALGNANVNSKNHSGKSRQMKFDVRFPAAVVSVESGDSTLNSYLECNLISISAHYSVFL